MNESVAGDIRVGESLTKSTKSRAVLLGAIVTDEAAKDRLGKTVDV